MTKKTSIMFQTLFVTVCIFFSTSISHSIMAASDQGWIQTIGGGSTYAKNVLFSYVPINNFFDKTTIFPGIVTTPWYQLSADTKTQGFDQISQKRWNTNQSLYQKDWVIFFQEKIKSYAKPATEELLRGEKPLFEKNAKDAMVLSVPQGLDITTEWNIEPDEKYIIIVNGALTIHAPIHLVYPNSGFIAFIVKNDMTITSSLGCQWDQNIPAIEGVYIIGGKIIATKGASLEVERLVLKGIFLTNNAITYSRSLTGKNTINSAILFQYNPQFLVNFPLVLSETAISWREVAP